MSSTISPKLPAGPFVDWLHEVEQRPDVQWAQGFNGEESFLGIGVREILSSIVGINIRGLHRLMNGGQQKLALDRVDFALAHAADGTRLEDLYPEDLLSEAAKAGRKKGTHCKRCGNELYQKFTDMCNFCLMELGQPTEELETSGEYARYIREEYR